MRKKANVSLEAVGYCMASLELTEEQVVQFMEMILHHEELPMITEKEFNRGYKAGAHRVAWDWM